MIGRADATCTTGAVKSHHSTEGCVRPCSLAECGEVSATDGSDEAIMRATSYSWHALSLHQSAPLLLATRSHAPGVLCRDTHCSHRLRQQASTTFRPTRLDHPRLCPHSFPAMLLQTWREAHSAGSMRPSAMSRMQPSSSAARAAIPRSEPWPSSNRTCVRRRAKHSARDGGEAGRSGVV